MPVAEKATLTHRTRAPLPGWLPPTLGSGTAMPPLNVERLLRQGLMGEMGMQLMSQASSAPCARNARFRQP